MNQLQNHVHRGELNHGIGDGLFTVRTGACPDHHLVASGEACTVQQMSGEEVLTHLHVVVQGLQLCAIDATTGHVGLDGLARQASESELHHNFFRC